jgi:hypothetical protein
VAILFSSNAERLGSFGFRKLEARVTYLQRDSGQLATESMPVLALDLNLGSLVEDVDVLGRLHLERARGNRKKLTKARPKSRRVVMSGWREQSRALGGVPRDRSCLAMTPGASEVGARPTATARADRRGDGLPVRRSFLRGGIQQRG